MSIRDVSGLPDDRVPLWIVESRHRHRLEKLRLCKCCLHFGTRSELLKHCDDTGHSPLVSTPEDLFIKR